MHQLDTLLIVRHDNQREDTLFQGYPELLSLAVKRRTLGSRLSGYMIEKDRKACLGKLFFIRFTDLCVLVANILEVCKFRYLKMTRDTSRQLHDGIFPSVWDKVIVLLLKSVPLNNVSQRVNH